MDGECLLCSAVRDAIRFDSSPAIENTPLRESERFLLIPCVGPLVAGQAIIVSRHHFPSLAAMGEQALVEYDAFVRRILGTERDWLEAEHGSAERDCAGACVIHAHVHLIPGMARFAEVFDGVLPELGCGDQLQLPEQGIPYVFLRGGLGQSRVFGGEGLPSQILRHTICASLGREDCDWRKLPRNHLLAETLLYWRSRG
jgi:diadenosine tetraphosphate (Ap4A) HIT family hydrolase